ncbi:MAG: 6-phosphogluconolactonase [Gammaproteobacteria bacterium]|nr:6-phosphogluconolactonase [Gammaproteobacteria bacterium]
MTAQLHVHPDSLAVASAVAQRWAELAKVAIHEHGRFTVALSGGRTPRILYELLASPAWRDRLPWDQTELYLGDERCVPADHVDSNARMVHEALLDRLPHPPLFFPMVSDPLRPDQDAAHYASLLRERLGDAPIPTFDLILLGMGADGHFASLFPGTTALEDREALVLPVREAHLDHRRISLSRRVIAAARRRIVMVTGADKRAALAEVLHKPGSLLPIARLQRQASLEWHVDQAAYPVKPTAGV